MVLYVGHSLAGRVRGPVTAWTPPRARRCRRRGVGRRRSCRRRAPANWHRWPRLGQPPPTVPAAEPRGDRSDAANRTRATASSRRPSGPPGRSQLAPPLASSQQPAARQRDAAAAARQPQPPRTLQRRATTRGDGKTDDGWMTADAVAGGPRYVLRKERKMARQGKTVVVGQVGRDRGQLREHGQAGLEVRRVLRRPGRGQAGYEARCRGAR